MAPTNKTEFVDSAVQVPVSRGEPSHALDTSNVLPDDATDRPILTRSLSRISTSTPVVYKVYKRRFFGLVQLILLNIVVAWDWTIFSPISKTAAEYFNTSESIINWLSTAYFFAFVVATPFTFYTLSKKGPKASIVTSAALLLVGNWIKYGGTKSNRYSVVMLGQILIGFSQPFVLSSPSTYSNVWFSAAGRTSATAVTSLANPLGAALGQLVAPSWATKASEVPNAVLYTTVLATVAALPAFFIPSKPPTPPTPAVVANTADAPALSVQLRSLFTSIEFYLLLLPFSVYVGFFNSFASLINQILEPYGFSEDDAGLAGAILILVGLVSAAITSPFMDKYKFYLLFIKLMVPIIGIMYLILIWAPPTKSIPFVYVVCAILGAASFSLVPVTLEFLVEFLFPLGPETGSTVCWAGGQLLGGIFVIVQDALKDQNGSPPLNMHRALVFQAVVSLAVIPFPLALGLFGRKSFVRLKRWESEQRIRSVVDIDTEDDDQIRVLGHEGNGSLRI